MDKHIYLDIYINKLEQKYTVEDMGPIQTF